MFAPNLHQEFLSQISVYDGENTHSQGPFFQRNVEHHWLTLSQVDEVKLLRRGEQVEGTLHLTPHHLIFSHTPPNPTNELSPHGTPERGAQKRPRELWITYPIIQICTLRPSPPASHLPSSIRLRCRDFTFVCFCFVDERKARDVYDSIKAWTCKLGRIEKLYAFSYQPQRPEKEVNGWDIYIPREEWKRQGISDKSTDKGWRISTINTDYDVGGKSSHIAQGNC